MNIGLTLNFKDFISKIKEEVKKRLVLMSEEGRGQRERAKTTETS